jgi:hypothetical protein
VPVISTFSEEHVAYEIDMFFGIVEVFTKPHVPSAPSIVEAAGAKMRATAAELTH